VRARRSMRLTLARTLYRLDYLTFIANNPAVRMRRRTRTA